MSDTPLAGRVAVVSGGGRGLGRSFCLALARQGAKVVVNNRNRVTDADGRGPADHVAGQIVAAGGEAVADHSDAADPVGGDAIVAAAMERWGRLDICVANAAVGAGGMVHKQPAALRPDHPGRVHWRPARRHRALRLRGQQGRPAGVRPVAGGGGRGPGRADWGLRLGAHIYLRNRGQGEDKRYASLLQRNRGSLAAFVLRYIYWAQGRVMWFVSLPVQAAMYEHAPIGPVTWLGAVVYFGDAVVWFGLWLLACSHWLGLVLVASPLYMTNMLVRHTGKRLLEEHMARSKGAAYADYVRRTSGFIPWPPR